MTIRLGILGMSPGNGHPFSWSAIFNGYDELEMSSCGFPAIPEYLAKQRWPDDRLAGAQVTHVWANNLSVAEKISRTSLVDKVVSEPEDMVGKIDAVLLARDDAENHFALAEPFLRAGLPIYIDKPVALNEAALDRLLSAQSYPGQIFSCSALRFATELRVPPETRDRIGDIVFVQGSTPKYWATYAIHLIDPLLSLLGFEAKPDTLFSGPIGRDGRFLALRWPDGGPDVHLMATGTYLSSTISFRIVGTKGETTLVFQDSFAAFKAALEEFMRSVEKGRSTLPEQFNRRAVQIIEMGMP